MNYEQLHSPAARTVTSLRPIPMDAKCAACGRRNGMHRVNTFQCPNPAWRTGNGQPQWLTGTFTEAPLTAPRGEKS